MCSSRATELLAELLDPLDPTPKNRYRYLILERYDYYDDDFSANIITNNFLFS